MKNASKMTQAKGSGGEDTYFRLRSRLELGEDRR